MEKLKNITTIILIALLTFGMSIAGILLPDAELSVSERRKLAQSPELTADSVFSGRYMTDINSYLADQFPLRESFRTLKSLVRFYGFRQKDNNQLYHAGGSLFKLEYPLREDQVLFGAGKLNSIYEEFLQGMKVYYSIIPDKNFFTAGRLGYPSFDYGALVGLMNENVRNMSYIDIFDCLTLEDYYRTDSHWRQERIYPVAQRLAGAMGSKLTAYEEYTPQRLSPYYGVYYGQTALPVKPDEIIYLTGGEIDSATVSSAEIQGELPVYDLEKFSGTDGYDIFLSGAQAVVTIQCNGPPGRELIIFRDSFGSSIAPFFAGAYSKITLIDLRYVASGLLKQFVSFKDQDVLFLYSTALLNNSMLLK